MANSIIGALRVILGADTAAFEKGFDDARKKLTSFEADLKKFGAAVGLAMTVAAGAIGHGIKKALEEADKLGKAAQSIGIPVEELSKLKHAADLSGVGFESLSSSMARFSRNMAEAAGNAESKAGKAFATIGVSATDANGKLRPTIDVMADLSGKFATFQDGAGKTALAMAFFGKSGAQMIPMLNAGRDGMREMAAEAERLGIVVSKDTAAKAEIFNDTLTKIGKVKDALFLKIAEKLLPALQQLANRFFTFASDATSVSNALTVVDNVFKSLITSGMILKSVFDVVASAIASVLASLILLGKGEWQASLEALKSGFKDIKAEVTAASAAITNLWTSAVAEGAKAAPEIAKQQAPVIDTTNRLAEAWRAAKKAHKEALDLMLTSPTETFTAKMDALAEAVKRGTISWGEFQKAVRKVHDENRQHMLDLASTTATALTTIFGKNKGAAIAAAVINTAVAITKALSTLPPPFSFAQAALTAAMGAAQIATISKTNFGGSSGGGASASVPSVGGGAGGAAAAAAGPQSGTLAVSGINPNDIFTGDQMRSLAEKLLGYQRDGGKVVFA